MGKRVADALVDTLAAHGVRRIYGVAGDSLNGITDSIRDRESMDWTAVRHEETAAFAGGRRRTSPDGWRSARAAAAPATCT